MRLRRRAESMVLVRGMELRFWRFTRARSWILVIWLKRGIDVLQQSCGGELKSGQRLIERTLSSEQDDERYFVHLLGMKITRPAHDLKSNTFYLDTFST